MSSMMGSVGITEEYCFFLDYILNLFYLVFFFLVGKVVVIIPHVVSSNYHATYEIGKLQFSIFCKENYSIV